MGKTSKKRKNLADKIHKSRSAKPSKKPSVFDLHINKQKHNILGRNNAIRGEVGNPLQSRTKAIKQRQKTLLQEYRKSRKSNVFKDNRVGETTDRLALERKREHQTMFSLEEEGEEEELTHLGQSVLEIEQFDDAVSSDSDDEDGRLGGDVAKEFFGGYLREKEPEKSWKERMAELIAHTRKEKYERQTQKDETQKKIEEMDAEFRNNSLLLMSKKSDGAEKPKSKPDDYDIRMRMQQFEQKGTPSDRLKNEEETAKEEAERLKKLEEDRQRRMRGDLASLEAPAHISADSLEDAFSYSYAPSQGDKTKENDDDEDGKDDGEEKDGENSDGEEDSDNSGEKDNDNSSGEEEDEDEDSDDSDLDDDEDEEEAEKAVDDMLKKRMEAKKNAPKSILNKTEAPTIDPEEQKKAEKEIPFTFTAPKDLDDLASLLKPYSPDNQPTVLERLVACYHPSLAEGNKEKLKLLFKLLLQYLLDAMSQVDSPPVQLMDRLTPLLHQLFRHDPDGSSKLVSQLVLNSHDEFQQICQRRGGRGTYMGLDTMMLLKLIQALYPTSDFQHPVVTPALHFMTAMLAQSPVQTGRDIAAGLYLCSLCAEYVSLSKRFIPEVINFLHGILFMAATKNKKKVEKVFPPFKPVGKNIDLLKVTEKVQEAPVLTVKKTLTAEGPDLDTDEVKVSCISTCVALLEEYYNLYFDLPAYGAIFAPVTEMLEKLPCACYPQGLQECIDKLKHALHKDTGPMPALTQQKQKVQPLKLIDPKIEEVFDGRKKRKGTREQLERERLKHRVKKEFKGALREVRKDSHFLANQKLVDTQKRDAERQKKLKRIYGDLSNQEGEVRALKRQKNRLAN
ncbi:hypothetical protein ACOMHN_009872 [Nucella lapillus]